MQQIFVLCIADVWSIAATLKQPGPNFIALLNGKQICVLTVAEKKIAEALAYFTG